MNDLDLIHDITYPGLQSIPLLAPLFRRLWSGGCFQSEPRNQQIFKILTVNFEGCWRTAEQLHELSVVSEGQAGSQSHQVKFGEEQIQTS